MSIFNPLQIEVRGDPSSARESLAEAAEVLQRSVEGENNLSEVGRLALQTAVDDAFDCVDRLDAIDAPFASSQIATSIVVGGLPRTGTTLLHDLLAQSPSLRAPHSWQLQYPCYESDDASVVNSKQRSEFRYSVFTDLAPRVASMHPLASSGIEECTPALQHSLRCLQNLVMFRARSYFTWLHESGYQPAYDLWARHLALLTSSGTHRLVLKSPLHFAAYDVLLSDFSPAAVVHIRRDLGESLDSFLQLVEATRQVFSTDVIDREELVEEWTEYLRLIATRTRRALDSSAVPLHVIDYERLTNAPLETVYGLCDLLDVERPSAQALIDRFLAEKSAHRYDKRPFDGLIQPLVAELRELLGTRFAI